MLILLLGIQSLFAQTSVLPSPQLPLEAHEKLITVMATNDIHGALETLSNLSAHVQAIRQGTELIYGKVQAGFLLLDGGDQFQGTLTSNFDEGQSLFKAMNQMGYDAIVPGNHDYDFGPLNWLEDKVSERTEDKNPRGAFIRLIQNAQFSVLSGNTFYKESFYSIAGEKLKVEGNGCKTDGIVDWNRVLRAEFVKPYQIFNRAGLRIAVIGLDHGRTPSTTTEANVSDLCFNDEADSYLQIQNEIKDQADVFIIVMHNGDVPEYSKKGEKKTELQYKSEEGSNVVRKILEKGGVVHAVVAGHTHQDNRRWIEGVPFVQSGADGHGYGRIDLIYNTATKKVENYKSKLFSSLSVKMKTCPKYNPYFCQFDTAQKQVLIQGQKLKPIAGVNETYLEAKQNVHQIASRKLGHMEKAISKHRYKESALADWMTDALRLSSGAEIAFMNASGIRTNLKAGELLYEQFFRVLPFNNRTVIIDSINGSQLQSLLEKSIKTCGKYGALMQSGLRVSFIKDCSKEKTTQMDSSAELVKVETLSGEVLFDREQGLTTLSPERKFKIATLDYLASGKSEFGHFDDGTAVYSDLGITRDTLADYLQEQPLNSSSYPDGRWKLFSGNESPTRAAN